MSSPITHTYYTDVLCFSLPHIIVIVVAVITTIVFGISTIFYQVAFSELNPLTQGILASPAAKMKAKVG